MIDVVGDLRLQITEWVIGEGGQMDDGVESLEVDAPDVSEVDPQLRNRPDAGAECALLKKVAAEANYLVGSTQQHGCHKRPDIALVPGQEEAHD